MRISTKKVNKSIKITTEEELFLVVFVQINQRRRAPVGSPD